MAVCEYIESSTSSQTTDIDHAACGTWYFYLWRAWIDVTMWVEIVFVLLIFGTPGIYYFHTFYFFPFSSSFLVAGVHFPPIYIPSQSHSWFPVFPSPILMAVAVRSPRAIFISLFLFVVLGMAEICQNNTAQPKEKRQRAFVSTKSSMAWPHTCIGHYGNKDTTTMLCKRRQSIYSSGKTTKPRIFSRSGSRSDARLAAKVAQPVHVTID